MNMEATKMSGAGNVFLVFEGGSFDPTHEFVRELVKQFDTKCEGVMFCSPFVANSAADSEKLKLDFVVDYFNPDGSTGMMCGNGARCAAFFARQKFGLLRDNVVFSMADDIYCARFLETEVEVKFPLPRVYRPGLEISLNGKTLVVDFVDNGAQHVVVEFSHLNLSQSFREDFETFDITHLGSSLRFHDEFRPNGCNVNFYKKNPDDTLSLRTFERGVEAETGACGTGALATAWSANRGCISSPVTVIPTSQLPLTVFREGEALWLRGPVEFLETIYLTIQLS